MTSNRLSRPKKVVVTNATTRGATITRATKTTSIVSVPARERERGDTASPPLDQGRRTNHGQLRFFSPVQRSRPGPPFRRSRPGPPSISVRAGPAVEHVTGPFAVKHVGPPPPGNDIGARASVQVVPAGVSDETVGEARAGDVLDTRDRVRPPTRTRCRARGRRRRGPAQPRTRRCQRRDHRRGRRFRRRRPGCRRYPGRPGDRLRLAVEVVEAGITLERVPEWRADQPLDLDEGVGTVAGRRSGRRLAWNRSR